MQPGDEMMEFAIKLFEQQDALHAEGKMTRHRKSSNVLASAPP